MHLDHIIIIEVPTGRVLVIQILLVTSSYLLCITALHVVPGVFDPNDEESPAISAQRATF